MSLQSLARVALSGVVAGGIFAPVSEEPGWRKAVAALRSNGERVVCGFPGQKPDYQELHCDRQLVWLDGTYKIIAV